MSDPGENGGNRDMEGEAEKMEMWFSELHTSNVKLSMRIEKQLFSGNSDCQRIDVLESVEFGKFLALDGDIPFFPKRMNLFMTRW